MDEVANNREGAQKKMSKARTAISLLCGCGVFF